MEEKALLEGSLSEKLMEEFMDTVREEVIAIAKTQPQRGQAKDTYTKSQVSTLGVGIITKRIQRLEKKAFKITFDLAQRGSNVWNADRGLGMSNPRGSWMGNVGGNYQQENPYESYYANNSMMGGGYGGSNMMGYQVCRSLNDFV